MNTPSIQKQCPKCGTPIPADAPQGLCPGCVLARAAQGTETGFQSSDRLTPPSLEAVRTAFPDLEILELIGLGGMGVVYKARQINLDRLVALKLLPHSQGSDPAFAERFHREARFLARLNHPNIVSVYDFGQAGGFCFLLLEFVDGVNLRQAMRAGRFSPDEALALVPKICSALQYAHEQGVLHRDIKPENILLDANGRVKLADFGIAKLVNEPGSGRNDITLTQSGARLGTPHYMAPEQVENPAGVDHRADIYSLGVVFYELLTGELPLGRFAAPSEKALLDARVDAIVLRALAKERELRQQSAAEVRTQVQGLGTADPKTAPKTNANRPNPWPHRLFWLIAALVVLPASAVIAAILAPALMKGGRGSSAGLLAGVIPAGTGIGLVIAFLQTRPKPSEARPRAEWNPWFQRCFWIVFLMVVMPLFLLVAGLVIPPLTKRYEAPAPVSDAPPLESAGTLPGHGQPGGLQPASDATTNLPTKVLPDLNPETSTNAAALKWRLAREQLEENRKRAQVGVIAPRGPEMLAAERDLEVAEADFRGNPVAAAIARLAYANGILAIIQHKVSAGVASRDEERAAKVAAAEAEEALQKAQANVLPGKLDGPR